MTDIAIFGADDFGYEVACLIRRLNECIDLPEERWNLIGFFDDGKEKGFRTAYGEVLGGMDELNAYGQKLEVVIALGNPDAVQSVVSRTTNPNVSFPNLIAPDVVFLDESSVEMGKGNIICSMCFIGCHVSMGNFNVVGESVVIRNDVKVGDCNVLMSGVRVAGKVKVGDCNFFDVGSIVPQQNEIGNRIKLAAGSVLMTEPEDGKHYIGIPAREESTLCIREN